MYITVKAFQTSLQCNLNNPFPNSRFSANHDKRVGILANREILMLPYVPLL